MSTPNKRYETEDGPVWKSRSVAVVHVVVASVNDVAYVLLTKRSDTMEDAPGKWCIPCGYLDWDETLKEAATREILEETKLDLSKFTGKETALPITLIGIEDKPTSNRQNISARFITILDLEELPKVYTTNEVSEVAWLDGDSVEALKEQLAFNHYYTLGDTLRVGGQMLLP